MEAQEEQKQQEKPQEITNQPGKIDLQLNGVRFWSTFDSGNLKNVEQITENFFHLYLNKDPGSDLNCWFYFKIQSKKQVALNLQIFDLNHPLFFKQFQHGKEVLIKKKGKINWKLIPLKGTNVVKNNNNKKSTFSIEFEVELEENTEYSIAFTYPWSYQHNQKWIGQVEEGFKKLEDKLYFCRELLTYSNEKKRVELLTISSYKGIINSEFESSIDYPQLFPEIEGKNQLRNCNKFENKKYILISTRVHAGETPANYILRGITNFLLEYNQNIDSRSFLDEFVLCIIPMLNPDGVIRGHYRYDSNGNDLNRCYNQCLNRKGNYPSNYAVMKLAKYLDSDNRLYAYFDLHAHVNYSGSFMYGNIHPQASQRAEIRVIPKLMSQYVPCFKYVNCGFNIYNGSKNSNYSQIQEFHESKRDLKHSVSDQDVLTNESKIKQKQQEYIENQKRIQKNYNSEQQQKDLNEIREKEKIQRESITALQGVAKTDVYLTTSTCLCYTVEANYTYYMDNENKKQKMKVSDFEQIGEGICFCLLEMGQKKQNSIFQNKLKKYGSLQAYQNEIYYDQVNK